MGDGVWFLLHNTHSGSWRAADCARWILVVGERLPHGFLSGYITWRGKNDVLADVCFFLMITWRQKIALLLLRNEGCELHLFRPGVASEGTVILPGHPLLSALRLADLFLLHQRGPCCGVSPGLPRGTARVQHAERRLSGVARGRSVGSRCVTNASPCGNFY